MSKKYYLDAISDEKLAEMIDKTLRYEKAEKTGITKFILSRIVPAAAVIALVIGFATLFPALIKSTPPVDDTTPGAAVASRTEITYLNEKEIELFLPPVIEKSFFENRVLKAFDDIIAALNNPEDKEQLGYMTRAKGRVETYYVIQNLSLPYSTELVADGVWSTYTFEEDNTNQFYKLDSTMSARETDELLEMLSEAGFTGNDMMRMYMNAGATLSEVDDPYAHVRFGETRDILLLDIEWHTAETIIEEFLLPGFLIGYEAFLEQVAEANPEELRELLSCVGLDDPEELLTLAEISESDPAEVIEYAISLTSKTATPGYNYYEAADRIKAKTEYISRTINGKRLVAELIDTEGSVIGFSYIPEGDVSFRRDNPFELSDTSYFDSDGYYIYDVYPRHIHICDFDENGNYKCRDYEKIQTKSEYMRIMENEAIPQYDDLLARGLVTQEDYDFYTRIKDPLDYYVNLWFN